ncbi:response regulator [Stakelama marina]|uniref:Response regulator n=1 Tax=Stakelama marina TaxID=2826939 RepID=A0A8T4IH55_9SPHN|nr:response regulator [Stakelama marina]MBR0551556.1 response regulator [Stakelama marina]
MTAITNILVVEDEPLIAMMLEDYLEMFGRKVAGTAETVDDALGRVSGGGIDAAILDVHLRGGEKSWPVADALAEAEIPFILATGGSGDTIAEQHKGRPVLNKPFTADGVEAALKALG